MRATRTPKNTINEVEGLIDERAGIIGYSKISSMSKIKKIKDTKKNWTENPCQLFAKGWKPHSKGDSLMSVDEDFIESDHAAPVIATASNADKINKVISIKIQYSRKRSTQNNKENSL